MFFGNSGAEANEGAIKVARKYSFDKYGPGRSTIVTLVNSFHGRTVTTLCRHGAGRVPPVFRALYGGVPLRGGQRSGFVGTEDLDDSVCAVMLEYIQGEGGVVPLEEAFVRRAF